MAKAKRNKPYRRKAVNPDALSWALAGSHKLPAIKQAELIGYVDASLDTLRRGAATRDDWNTLANGMNIAEALVHFQIGTNLLPQIEDALSALHDVALRMLKTGRSTCYAAELAAITEGRDLYKIQMSLCSQAEMMRAVARVQNMHRSGAMQEISKVYREMATC